MKKFILSIILLSFIASCSHKDKEAVIKIKQWDECTKASCWNGSNAQQRMMNMLSPFMSTEKFNTYMTWMKSRGCNTAHVFVSNKADGEKAGYCIYGRDWDWSVDPAFVKLMNDRIDILVKNGFGVVVWLFADDSSAWNSKAKTNFQQYLNDLNNQGLLKYASTIVVGLELDEYYNANDVSKLVSATRKVYPGKIGVHQTSYNYGYAKYGDIMFYQIKPGNSTSKIKSEVIKVRNATGKPVNMFEMERNPAQDKCNAAFSAGAYAVANW